MAASAAGEPTGFREVTFRSNDGLKLFARDYGDPLAPNMPVVCLPGLTRTSRDFHDLAMHLATDRERPRRVLALDYRGRGRSDDDRNVDNYNPLTEMNDVVDGMSALGIPRAVIIGTSRGGIIAMIMGVARPAMLAGLVLNDIGPMIEARGLARIKTYVGRMPAPDTWDDAVMLLRRLHGAQFTALAHHDWEAWARLTWRDEGGVPKGDYDPALATTLDGIEFDKPVPNLWNEFRALPPGLPLLVIRGENSDLLTPATVEAMAEARPGMTSLVVEGEGHAPLLRGPLLARIGEFVATIDKSG
ncbi:MAG: alpha/beta hydrolase [Rhizobiales bacterium]|nr:alpha/beta hydrolase [Hyphomicrobiales bacterium]